MSASTPPTTTSTSTTTASPSNTSPRPDAAATPQQQAKSNSSQDMRVLIVGGGIAGLTIAAMLHQRQFKHVEVVERVKEYADVGYVLGLMPNGSRVLRGLPGLYDAYMKLGDPELFQQFEVYKGASGQQLAKFSMESVIEKYGPSTIVKRADFVKLLYSYVKDNVPVRLGTSLTSIEQDDNGAHVKFTDNTEGTYDLVIGADGLRSKTRRLVFGDIPLKYYNITGWGFWVKQTDDLKFDSVREYWGKGKTMGVYPHRSGDDAVVACFCGIAAPRDSPDPVEQRFEKIRREFAEFGGVVPEILKQLEDPDRCWHDDFLEVELPGDWYNGRVCLIGDACHAVLPTAGSGASMALETCAVLVEELCRASGNLSDLRLAFTLWQKRRKPRVASVRKEGHRIAELYTWKNSLAVLARDSVLKLLGSNSMLFSDTLVEIMETPI